LATPPNHQLLPLAGFVRRLRAAGFAVDAAREFQLRRVLHEQGVGYIGRFGEFKYALAPYVATNGGEQRRFYRLWDDYVASLEQQLVVEPENARVSGWQKWTKQLRYLLMAVGVLLLAILAWSLIQEGPAAEESFMLVEISQEAEARAGQPLQVQNATLLEVAKDSADFVWDIRDAETGESLHRQDSFDLHDTSELSSGECGVAFANSIREKNSQVPIIFLVDSFKDDCYEKVKSFDQSSILSKELSKLKLLQAVKYSLLQLDYSKLAQQYSERLFSPEQPGNAASTVMNEEKFFFKIGDSFKAIEKEEISFFFADKKLSHARVGKRNFPTNVQLKTLGDALSPSFLRCHRKYLLNISHIEAISMKEGKVKINGEFLPIGVSYRKSFFGRLNLLK
jgi:DNA-binding LytR/AlgR family response regulator